MANDLTQRVALGVEYLGTQYHGWQKQSHDPNTVQAYVESGLFAIAGEPIQVYCAGRTDSGVHAVQQVIHFDTAVARPNRAWVRGVNRYLPSDIAIQWAQTVSSDFHARYSAIWRQYQYWLCCSKVRLAIFNGLITRVYTDLDVELMQLGADFLIGEHDFTSFRAQDCQAKTAAREIFFCMIRQIGDYVVLDIKANAFLKHMVRNIVGSLLLVGQAKRPPNWIQEVLLKKNRAEAGATAPPQGLFLHKIGYPINVNLPDFPNKNPFFV